MKVQIPQEKQYNQKVWQGMNWTQRSAYGKQRHILLDKPAQSK